MMKHLALCLLASVVLASAAPAQIPAPGKPYREPAVKTVQSTEDCIRQAFDLAQNAEAKIVEEDKLDQIEDLLARMEAMCDAKQYSEAMAIAEELQKVIEGE